MIFTWEGASDVSWCKADLGRISWMALGGYFVHSLMQQKNSIEIFQIITFSYGLVDIQV
jgi:hypothetical protein